MMSFNDVASHSQADACSLDIGCPRTRPSNESFKDLFLFRNRNSDTLVSDADNQTVSILCHFDPDGAAIRRILYRVVENVSYRQTESFLIGTDERIFTSMLKFDKIAVGFVLKFGQYFVHQFHRTDKLILITERTRFNAAEIEQRFDKVLQPLAFAGQNVIGFLTQLLRINPPFGQHLREMAQ